jgi:ABC-type dipeptide/oligopeptide/nickel transport system permease subunit
MRLLPLTLLLAVAIFSPWFAPHQPERVHTDHLLEPHSRAFPLGTDSLGRCLLSRLVFGARLSFAIALAVTAASALIGGALGSFAGWSGGRAAIATRFATDLAIAFPGIILGLAIAGIAGPGIPAVIAALTATQWVKFARVSESIARQTRSRGFVEAALVADAPRSYVIRKHLLPELAGPILVLITFGAGTVMLHAAALSFLGLGVMPPAAEWGAMLYAGRSYLAVAPRLTVAPGLAIWFSVAALQLAAGELQKRVAGKLPYGWEGI